MDEDTLGLAAPQALEHIVEHCTAPAGGGIMFFKPGSYRKLVPGGASGNGILLGGNGHSKVGLSRRGGPDVCVVHYGYIGYAYTPQQTTHIKTIFPLYAHDNVLVVLAFSFGKAYAAFMNRGQSVNPQSEIPKQIFETFLAELKKGGAPEDLLERLDLVLSSERNLTENAIKSAIFPEAQTP